MKTILIVDDESDIAEVLGDIFELEGFRVLRAANGKEGLERISHERPDVILLDMMMPVMDGREMLALLTEDEALRSIPVIATSAVDLYDVKAKYGVRCISKPYEMEALLGLVADALAGGA